MPESQLEMRLQEIKATIKSIFEAGKNYVMDFSFPTSTVPVKAMIAFLAVEKEQDMLLKGLRVLTM